MLSRNIAKAAPWRATSVCCFCAARSQLTAPQRRSFSATETLLKRHKKAKKKSQTSKPADTHATAAVTNDADATITEFTGKIPSFRGTAPDKKNNEEDGLFMSLKEALLGASLDAKSPKTRKQRKVSVKNIKIEEASAGDFSFEPIEVAKPPVPMLAYGLDRVLFNPGVYRLQDPRTGVYNFDPYLEKIMPVKEFDFDALSEYKTSSKDEDLLAITRQQGIKYTGSTSSMSGVLQHFHYLLSAHRKLNHSMLSRAFPDNSDKFSRITLGPDAVFLRYKNGVYAIDADKTYDRPNVMSWLGHSLEKLLTTERTDFERYRRSNPEQTPSEDESARCFHYTKQGSILMRSQLDARDPRLPGAGIFDLKTRAVVSIRMNHNAYKQGLGYQLRYTQGEWESFEREFYDMTRATMLKYSLQVRMGRMDGIFIAYHNIERIFGFQYLSLSEMDQVLHGQTDTCLGDQEFRLSVGLLEELLNRATEKFPETSLRLHFETRDTKAPFMYVFAEPVTEERADEIQDFGKAYAKAWARRVVGVGKEDPERQEAWQDLQEEVDEQLSEDGSMDKQAKLAADEDVTATEKETDTAAEQDSQEIGSVNEDGSKTENEKAEGSTVARPIMTEDTTSSGPLMGWTLTVRNKVNGHYLARPEKLEPDDNWQIEYHIKDIEDESVWGLYNTLKQRRRQLIGRSDDEMDKGLMHYRKLIQRYASSGRNWRAEQDKLNAERGTQLFKPLGPGSEEYASARSNESAAAGEVESRGE